MTQKRGRKSQADLMVAPKDAEASYIPPPKDLDAKARVLWQQIVKERPAGFFGAGDLPLLREYCHTTEVLLPRMNRMLERRGGPNGTAILVDASTIRARNELVKLAASLAGKLRLCVSSRTRPDTAGMRDSLRKSNPPWLGTSADWKISAAASGDYDY